ncbi:hypothetical protein Back2_07820 [Nocardioides baekrokdamisoli]|uniref:Uncharacterized protein n=1 Tax=Nocardioides baekrokdamisoli TaxID=1804624 RepID=A0A3G9IK99_9ACTN|nr:hypothetical protein [Nocardioides baekrokdamisoli]BBH16495.1 hypothetical protein Back2_07820 [Nocardioides baekrokdamisoli]
MAAADPYAVAPGSARSLRTIWLLATLLLTVGPLVLAVSLAPSIHSSPPTALVWLLFVGSSVHVGATAWFYTVADVRTHMRGHPWRYYWIPLALVVVTAMIAAIASTEAMTWVLSGYFAWQFFHFQKQNLGISALAARSLGAARLTGIERAALTVAGIGGVGWLVAHPALLQIDRHGVFDSWLHPALQAVAACGAGAFVSAVLVGATAAVRRPRSDRPAMFLIIYGTSLAFFLPAFLFESPYAAVAGLTIAHGMQYLLLVGLIAGAPTETVPAQVGVLICLNIAVVLGLVLNQASHLHSGTSGLDRWLFGGYLGAVMAHFVIDAGLWRLRDEFPRAFLTRRLPYLLAPQ